MFVDIDCHQEKKYNQNAYGDYFISKRYPDIDRLIAVLSDGLGSGVKANILASMTATMLLKFIEENFSIGKACEIIMNALPVCQVRHISYATFSAMDYNSDGDVAIVEEGNPEFIWVRDGKVMQPEHEIITSKNFPNRNMHVYTIKVEKYDRIIFCSDGVTQAGLGNAEYKLGLRRKGLVEFILNELLVAPCVPSRELSRLIVDHALRIETNREAHDDISAVSIYFRDPREALVFTGPPYYQDKDSFYAGIFKNFKGTKAICGGTTANILSRELNIPVESRFSLNSGELPAVSYMEGVDLVTEGILTLTKVSEYLEKGKTNVKDAAGDLVRFFLNSDCINFMVGAKINQAHYDPKFPIEIEVRKNIIKKISNLLEEKYIKKVLIQYM